MDLYDELKTLNNISRKAIHMHNALRYTTQYVADSREVLIVCRNNKERNEELKKWSNSMKLRSNEVKSVNNEKRIIKLVDGTVLHLKTISECEHLEGYRFREFYFI